MAANLLRQQEGISQAANTALWKAQNELQMSRDRLAAANQELSAQIIERTRAEEKQRDFAGRLQHLHRIDNAILSAESLTAIADIALNYLANIIPAHSITIALLDVDKRKLTVLGSTNSLYPPGLELPITLIDMLNRLGTGEAVYVPDYSSLPRTSTAIENLVSQGVGSGLHIPLRYRNQLIGAFSIVLPEVRPFSETEEAIAKELAGSLAVALQNRRLLDAEREAREREITLREVAAALTLDLGLNEILNRVLAQLERVITSDSSSIMLSDGHGLEIVCQRGVENVYDDLAKLLKARPRSVWSVLETAQPRIISDTRASPDWILARGREYIRSWMGVPLLVKGECIGIMTIDRRDPNAFSAHDMELATTFANQAAVAIENARLFSRQQAHAEELERGVRERTRDLEALYGITATAVGSPDMVEFLQRAMALTGGALGCVAAATFLGEGEVSNLQLAALLESGDPDLSKLLATLDPTASIVRRSFAAGLPEILSSRELPPEWGEQAGLALGALPLRSRGQSLGVLILVCFEDARLTTVASDLLTTIADQIGAVVENIRLHQITRQSAIIEERERLARDIHDQVTQSIYSASLFAEAARGAAEAGHMDKLQQHHHSILRMTNQALRELRLLLFEFRTEALARKGLIDALRERLNTVEHRAGISGEVYAPSIGNLPMAIEETYYRIALEALNNSLRHARGDRVDIILLEESGHLIMTIVDNGIGFDQETAVASGGMGLEGMQKRIGKVGGELTLSSSPGGTWVTARAPLNQ
jgi:signal transduction histidine kinase